jgi:TonB family protein
MWTQRRKRSSTDGQGWRRAISFSLTVHGLAFAALAIRVGGGAAGGAAGHLALAVVEPEAASIPTFVDLEAVDVALALAPASQATLATPPPPDLSDAPRGDVARAAAAAMTPDIGRGRDRRAPAPDRGDGAGIRPDDPAFRRDASTLRERLSDGATSYQPSHARTASRAASPEAVRREQITGIGDSARTARPRRAAPRAAYGVIDPREAGAGAPTRSAETAAAPPPEPIRADESSPAPIAERALASASLGPLDADRGPQSFDVVRRGGAADDQDLRAASEETRPGITDLTLSAVAGAGSEGHGPGELPGATSRPTPGSAAARAGVADASLGPTLEERTRERQYQRYDQEIRRRVREALIFPKQLALRLEQGETVVRFVVQRDGQVGDTLRVVKSSGFAEFDEAALDAVRRALPFPPPPAPLRASTHPVKLPVSFDNPVIR